MGEISSHEAGISLYSYYTLLLMLVVTIISVCDYILRNGGKDMEEEEVKSKAVFEIIGLTQYNYCP